MSKPIVWPPRLTLVALIALIYVTLCPIELRPHTSTANAERFWAYFVFGILASVSFPRRTNTLIFAIAAIAFALEASQLLIPGRDAGFPDACVKVTGGVCGAFVIEFGYAMKRRFFAPNKKRHTPRSTQSVRVSGRPTRAPSKIAPPVGM